MLSVAPQITSKSSSDFRLLPEQNVESGEHYFIATSKAPWLRLATPETILGQRWVRIRYRSSFYDNPVRPLIRFVRADKSTLLYSMSAPIFGAAEWIGRVPDDAVDVHISPTNYPGPFNFEIEDVSSKSRLEVFLQTFRHSPLGRVDSLVETLTEPKFLHRALNATVLANYAEWVRSRGRPVLHEGIDRPRLDWSKTPLIRLLVLLDHNSEGRALQTTVDALERQTYGRWELHALLLPQTPHDLATDFERLTRQDSRFSLIDRDRKWWTFSRATSGYWSGVIDLGDSLPDYAIATMIETIGSGRSSLAAVYSDEDFVAADGTRCNPVFKPDWSPRYHAAAQFIGRLTLIRGDLLEATGKPLSSLLLAEPAEMAAIVEKISRCEFAHVRRVLYHHSQIDSRSAASQRAVSSEGGIETHWPRVTIVVPTRDRADLLRSCHYGLKERTDYPHYDVVVVDNGTRTLDALALLDRLKSDARFSIIRRPGKFNFSELCNMGAKNSDSDILVFLNNDVSMISRGWLKEMVRWAMRPDVGAVGPKLKFPNGKIQHAGVVLALDDLCLHKYRYAPDDESGYMQQLKYPHEVAAVTGACLAVERRKFKAVGGFDAENLPVELSDIDLCLKLASEGWTSIWTPHAELYHQQSASRAVSGASLYGFERSNFLERWRNIIRDDPFLHPALSFIRNAQIVLG